ncbi:tRNA glutamyl-Q(34) synthetase GluQRS [Caulobacter hibisci]|uniref:tRNA glutamyl-Q(34) synthetase GluQRS n=1 Tax=Caulobacter hibisci TaxID=2035993 RepID=A0ABS0SSF8_9CAUL|nr:tRNA glutamyl-Q(34) synthetase GluQRS [Caulobacter hibisci]MBI1682281.1 tRNA glutamyl-Q(34) synthetase GluQRS [Caulobacter hibisci]
MPPFATRFAPSPTGFLHRGHAFSALTAFDAARAAGGRFVLRIEDIDAIRSRPEYEAGILEDLAWLGLEWEQPLRRQSEHLADYHAAIETLRERGLVYRCFKTRRELDIGRAPHEPAVPYRGAPLPEREEAERLARGDAFAWRLSLDAAARTLGGFEDLSFVEEGAGPDVETGLIRACPETAGDIVLARKDVGVAYHLAVVLDDALQGITHVIRGQDLFEAAHIQRLLQALLDLPTPTYRHHGLLVGSDGKRYAKRDNAQTLRELRAAGATPQALRAEMGL